MKAKKAIVALGCAGLLVAGSVAGTLAYLTADTEVVTNTFTVGKVSIDLDEADVDVYGEVEYEIDGTTLKARVTANEYKLIPGHEYTKDPTVHVAKESEESYVFVKVVNGIDSIEADGNTTIAKQMEDKGWVALSGEQNVYVYDTDATDGVVGTIVDARANVVDLTVFETFTIAGDAELTDEMANLTITIDAYAIQADGFTDAADAWNNASTNWN